MEPILTSRECDTRAHLFNFWVRKLGSAGEKGSRKDDLGQKRVLLLERESR